MLLFLLYLSKYFYVIFSEKYWSKLPDDWLKSLVKLFHKASAELIGQISCGEINQDTQHLENFLQILKMVCQVTFSHIVSQDVI